jgi:hypothetical protein
MAENRRFACGECKGGVSCDRCEGVDKRDVYEGNARTEMAWGCSCPKRKASLNYWVEASEGNRVRRRRMSLIRTACRTM